MSILVDELGVVIIWSNHLHHSDAVVSDLSQQFSVLEIYDIEWDKNILYQNFYHFYGDRLSSRSIKEKTIGGAILRLIIFRDLDAQHDFRSTARGIEKVNCNFFDVKKKFRKKFETRFGIHASNDEIEANKDLSLLLGINLKDYKKTYPKKWNEKIKQIKRNVSGVNGWKSLEQFFYCLNTTTPYIILRNFDNLSTMKMEDDIDFLVDDLKKFVYFSGAKKMSKGTQRANYRILVNGKNIDIDIRYVGDGYFDSYWQRDCIQNRILHKNNFYVPDELNLYYSLLYHALIHKKEFLEKYEKYFNLPMNILKSKLYDFMHRNNYHMVEPKDITLFFHRGNGGDIKFSRARRLRNKTGFIGLLKRTLHHFNNAIHFKRGAD